MTIQTFMENPLLTTIIIGFVLFFIFLLSQWLDDLLNAKEERKNKTVTCEDCKCEIKEENAYKIESMHLYYGDLYYCNKCKPNYDKIGIDFDGIKHYYKQLEVTKDGEPVGYKKK